MRTRGRHRQRGSIVAEFVIGIVFIGVVLGPFLVYVVRVQDLNSAIGQQGRREAWRSFSDQALAAGIDPSLAPGLANALNPSVPAMIPITVGQGTSTVTAGLAQLVPIRTVLESSFAEKRAAGAGLQLGPGAAVAPRSTPAAPLTPIVMPTPVVTPANGTVIAIADLSAGAAGDPYTIDVEASSMAGSTVTLALNQPAATVIGPGSARRTVTAVDLLNRVNGVAWTEFTGNAGAGDQAVALSDGRTRWLVTRSDGRLQIYEPSLTTGFTYQIAIGTPVIARGGVENASGATLTFDYAGWYDVQTGTTALVIDYPAAVKAAFGNAWGSQSIGFTWTFASIGGPFSGQMQGFFTEDALANWADSVPVAAVPVVPVGANTSDASWTLTRSKTALGAPVRTAAADGSGFWSPGQQQFTAPNSADGTPIGRLSVDNNVSTGTTLTVPVVP